MKKKTKKSTKAPSWKEVGEQILKSTVMTIGQNLLTTKVAPVASDVAQKVWQKVKETKRLVKEDSSKIERKTAPKPTASYRRTKTVNVSGHANQIVVDAEFIDCVNRSDDID